MPQIRTAISWVTITVLIVLLLPTAVGGLFGSPAGVSYVETNSMTPTLSPGDGFILIPNEVTGSPEPGDVVVFRAERLGGGGLTTHRIIRETPRGYITQGDNNNAPDQAGQEPPVQQEQIVGQVLRVNDQIVVIPRIGHMITFITDLIDLVRSLSETILWRIGIEDDLSTSQLSTLLAGILAVWYAIEWFRSKGRTRQSVRERRSYAVRRQSQLRSSRVILFALIAMLALSTTAAMVLPSGAQQHGAIASKSEAPVFVTPGEEQNFTHRVGGSPILPMVAFLDGGNDVKLAQQKVYLQRGEIANVSAIMSVPSSVGYHRFYVVEYRYIPILPMRVIYTLYQIHPWLPVAIIDVLIVTPWYLIGRYTILDRGPVRTRSRRTNRR